MPVDTIGRELIELVQIDQDFCNNTYGESPCAAQVYQFDFNGDGYIETQRRWNPDAVDPSFTVKFSADTNQSGTIISQNISSNSADKEFQVYTQLGDVNIFIGGSFFVLNPISSGSGDWSIVFDGANLSLYESGVFQDSVLATVGIAREPSAIMRIGARGSNGGVGYLYNGVIKNVELETSEGLILDMPINDNSNTIKDYAGVDDGALTAGTGSWSGTGNQKCIHTYTTCQDQPNYDKGKKQITFKNNQSGDVDEYTIPILNGFSVTLPELNIFSRDTKNQALGKFGKCSVTFSDTIFSDNHLDPYVSERRYNPLEQGTFWTKFLARNPYYEGWKIRLYDGLVGQTLAEMNVREYELEKITNPDSNGKVTIKATDLMRRLDNSKAIYPPPSNCKLKDNIAAGQGTFDTIGKLTTYPDELHQEKYMLIGGESSLFNRALIISETDNGDGTYTYVTDRNSSSSPAVSQNTRCENAAFFSQITLQELVIYLLSIVYESDEYESALNITAELLKIAHFGEVLSHYLSRPQPVGDIMAELEREMGFVSWYDDIEKIIKIKSIADESDPVTTITQENDLVQGATSTNLLTTDRVSDIYIQYNAVIDWTDEQTNYTRSLLLLDSDSSSSNEYGSKSTYNIDTDWMLVDSLAEKVANRVLTQFRDITREKKFELDIKTDIRIGQVFKLAWRGYTDIYGNPEVINWICTGRTRTRDRLKITAQEFKFNVPEA